MCKWHHNRATLDPRTLKKRSQCTHDITTRPPKSLQNKTLEQKVNIKMGEQERRKKTEKDKEGTLTLIWTIRSLHSPPSPPRCTSLTLKRSSVLDRPEETLCYNSPSPRRIPRLCKLTRHMQGTLNLHLLVDPSRMSHSLGTYDPEVPTGVLGLSDSIF